MKSRQTRAGRRGRKVRLDRPPAPVRVKICGITSAADARVAVAAGADAIGLVFAERSPRHVTPAQAAAIVRQLPPWVIPVGVFVNEPMKRLVAIATRCRLGSVQLHGEESPAYCRVLRRQVLCTVVKAFRLRSAGGLRAIRDYRGLVDAVLIDAASPDRRGGTGAVADWRLARRARRFGIPLILAGGLRPETVAAAIRQVQPQAVDVSSGVERCPGAKDAVKVRQFIQRARAGSR